MKKLFTNDKFFEAISVLAVLSGIFCVNEILIFNNGSFQDALLVLFDILCIVALYVSYREHSKNVMKGLMGAILSVGVISSFLWIDTYTNVLDMICSVAYVFFTVFLFVNHFVINSERHPSPVNVKLNQIVAILLSIVSVVWNFSWIKLYDNFWDKAELVSNAILCISVVCFIVCVESRLDAYRIDREEAGWSEEKGYPENYVHESEIRKDI